VEKQTETQINRGKDLLCYCWWHG